MTTKAVKGKRATKFNLVEFAIESLIRTAGISAIVFVALIFLFLIREGAPAFTRVALGNLFGGLLSGVMYQYFGPRGIDRPDIMWVSFALLAAVKAFRPELDIPVAAPLTPERVLMTLYGDRLQELKGLRGEKTGAREYFNSFIY